MASQQEIRRRSSTADRAPLTESVIASRASATTFASPPDLSRAHQRREESSPGRPSRAASTASRRNRLSLTLPVALSNADATRISQSPITTGSVVATSIPATPLDSTNGAAAPWSASEFIIAIAAQERRVFELKEELARAETELVRLKKQWTADEVYRKRSDSQRTDSSRCAASIDDDSVVASKRSIELDRKKLLLQTQQGSMTPSNRTVLRGNHTRTLSLLSPSKTDGVFSMHEHSKSEAIILPQIEQRAAQMTSPRVTNRTSWQPKPPPTSNVAAIPQIVEDFKFGFRAFVEDIRQITIGDEPITGQQRPTTFPSQRGNSTLKIQSGESTSTIPTRPERCKANSTADGSSTGLSTATQLNKTPESKLKYGKPKHFSWTPLRVDSIDDTDWSNWDCPDSPSSAKSARWSGSTVNSNGLDEIQSVSEDGDEGLAKGTKIFSPIEDPLVASAVEGILPNVVNRLSTSNFRRTANSLMDEWEKSLMTAESCAQANCV